MTLIPLQSGSKRVIGLASPATLIPLQSAQIAGDGLDELLDGMDLYDEPATD